MILLQTSGDMVTGQMVAGLANIEHQSRIFAKAAPLTTLDQKFERLVSLETTEKSTLQFHNDIPPSHHLMCKGRTEINDPRE